MKKLAVILTLMALMSCGASKTVRASKKVIKGQWSLQSVTNKTPGSYKVHLLNDSPKSCFINSSWQFIPNNNTGNYSINNNDCSTGARYFIFTIIEQDERSDLYDFLLKPTDEKGKSETNRGFRIQLTQLTDSNMEWQQTVNVDGQPFTIIMSFSKL